MPDPSVLLSAASAYAGATLSKETIIALAFGVAVIWLLIYFAERIG